MRILDEASFSRIREEEKATRPQIRNLFTFAWFNKTVSFDTTKAGRVNQKLGDCFAKIDTVGKVVCQHCDYILDYRNRGWKSLEKHVLSAKHKQKVETRRSNYVLPAIFGGRSSTTSATSSSTSSPNPSGTSGPVPFKIDAPQRLIPIQDRVINNQVNNVTFYLFCFVKNYIVSPDVLTQSDWITTTIGLLDHYPKQGQVEHAVMLVKL